MLSAAPVDRESLGLICPQLGDGGNTLPVAEHPENSALSPMSHRPPRRFVGSLPSGARLSWFATGETSSELGHGQPSAPKFPIPNLGPQYPQLLPSYQGERAITLCASC